LIAFLTDDPATKFADNAWKKFACGVARLLVTAAALCIVTRRCGAAEQETRVLFLNATAGRRRS
jgi:hypothetical protein